MAEDAKRPVKENELGQGPNREHGGEDPSLNDAVRGNVSHEKGSAGIGGASSMDEKSSTMGRRDKGTGLATKDGLTGSDYDGQLTE